ncbi:hypothetical protein Hanom_Chr14g01292061 [Helianthus anomalus]
MPSSYPGRHMPLPGLEPSTSEKRWVSVANWATPVGSKNKEMLKEKLINFKNQIKFRVNCTISPCGL